MTFWEGIFVFFQKEGESEVTPYPALLKRYGFTEEKYLSQLLMFSILRTFVGGTPNKKVN
jgi:hypothetical protein